MATSITQAKPLLTAAELELFDHSRSEPIKLLSTKQLAGKEKRTRALRDKYRDLYRRQTVAVRGKVARASATGDANARTLRKAEIMQEMLDRFEARSSLLAARDARSGASKSNGATRKAAAPAALPKPGSDARKSAVRAKNVKSEKSAESPQSVKRAEAAPALASAATDRKARAAATPVTRKSGRPLATEKALSAVGTLESGQGGAPQPAHFAGKDPAPRSLKAPSPLAPTYGGKARAPDLKAPLDMVPAALRENPIKSAPGSQAIQGHVSSNVRRVQAKRDSR